MFQQLVPAFPPKQPEQRGGFCTAGDESAPLLQVLFGVWVSPKGIQTRKFKDALDWGLRPALPPRDQCRAPNRAPWQLMEKGMGPWNRKDYDAELSSSDWADL